MSYPMPYTAGDRDGKKPRQVLTFENVTLYLKGGLGVTRVDAKKVTLNLGFEYAQYKNAISVKYLEPRKRRESGVTITSFPFLVIVKREHAINPGDPLGAPLPGNVPGITVRKSLYSSCDPRWESDFLASLKAAGVEPLFSAEGWDPHGN